MFDSRPLSRWATAYLNSTSPFAGDAYSEPVLASSEWWEPVADVVEEVLIWGGGNEILIDGIEAGLARRVVDLLSLARKAGDAVAGFEKVKGWLADGKAKVLLQASDGSDRGKGKLWTPPGGRWFGCLTASEIGLAFGRDHVIHSALAPGGLTDKVIRDASRLDGLRGHGGSSAAERDAGTDER